MKFVDLLKHANPLVWSLKFAFKNISVTLLHCRGFDLKKKTELNDYFSHSKNLST